MMSKLFYVLCVFLAVAVVGIVPAIAAAGVLGVTHWSIAFWSSLGGAITLLASFWLGATDEGNVDLDNKKLLAQGIGAVLGIVAACVIGLLA